MSAILRTCEMGTAKAAALHCIVHVIRVRTIRANVWVSEKLKIESKLYKLPHREQGCIFLDHPDW